MRVHDVEDNKSGPILCSILESDGLGRLPCEVRENYNIHSNIDTTGYLI